MNGLVNEYVAMNQGMGAPQPPTFTERISMMTSSPVDQSQAAALVGGGVYMVGKVVVRGLAAVGGYYLAKQRGSSTPGVAAWTIGSYFFPSLVPAIGIIATLR